MDDPWDWDADRLVRELCSLDRTWTPSSNSPKLPDSLETRLREQKADGHTILTCNEGELFNALEIGILKYKSTFRDAFTQFRERSQKYKLSQTTPIDDPSTERMVASPHKQRRIAPTAVSDENDINAQQFPSYLGPDVITQPDRLDTSAGIDGLQESAKKIASKLIRNEPFYAQLQEEMGKNNKALKDTAAGMEVMAELSRIKEQHRAELEDMQKMILETSTQQNEHTVAALKEHYQNMLQDMEKIRADEKRMNQEAVQSLQARIASLENRGLCAVM
ncbi:hypothetical protein F4821DRAFT_252390 [Hypoxylon rubiginosum]|uniref:Uncharacterized protein n=1 Tax=Hypoxylon rubiginosum TaxID=110542 RepID=A0ACC0CI82_9PEZI|nr:hypothetical protein F4821DRAFT_252390 [Hypoxylon rubiginosum]